MNGPLHRLVALLRLRDQRLPQQQTHLDPILALPKFRRACLDTTGLGLGLAEYAQEKWGHYKKCRVSISLRLNPSVIASALERPPHSRPPALPNSWPLTSSPSSKRRSLTIEVILDADAREDLRKPEKITSPGGCVSIASQRQMPPATPIHFLGASLWPIRAAQNVTVLPCASCPLRPHRAQVIAARRIREFLG